MRISVIGASVGAVTAALLLGVAGCAGPTQKPVDHTLRPIEACPATAVIPADVSSTVPNATTPTTSLLQVGDAVAFTAAAGSAVSSVGVVDDPQGVVVCQAVRGSGANRQVVILGLNPGFIHVGLVVPGSSAVRSTLVTVTP